MKLKWLALGLALFPTVALSKGAKETNACPAWLANLPAAVPECPQGVSVLPETYPAAAVLVSDTGYSGRDEKFAQGFVEKVLLAAGNQPPLVLLPVSDSTYASIRARVRALAGNNPERAAWLGSLRQVPGIAYTWQQDYFESFAGTNGQPVLRPVFGYYNKGPDDVTGVHGAELFQNVMRSARSCGFTEGLALRDPGTEQIPGTSGGNIEALPGGLCLVGDDSFTVDTEDRHWNAYAEQACGPDKRNRIKVPTSWLAVGHVDEIMRLVPNQNRPAPCNFSVSLASPRKAIELLRAQPNDMFLDFPEVPGESPAVTKTRRSSQHEPLSRFCGIANSQSSPPKSPGRRQNELPPVMRGVWNLLFFPWAQADTGGPDPTLGCSSSTNQAVVSAWDRDAGQLRSYNELVQAEMDRLRELLHGKLKERFPQCEPDFIDLPNLFMGEALVEGENGARSLPRHTGKSILPNAANAVSINNTVISPEPGNAAFREGIEAAYSAAGIQPEFIDTFDFAHQGQGNLHCVTHTIHTCRPRTQLAGER